MIDIILIASISILFSTLGIYLLVKPKQAISDGSGTVDSIIATIVIHVLLLFMTTKHLGAILLFVGIGLGIVMYMLLFDAFAPGLKAVRFQ